MSRTRSYPYRCVECMSHDACGFNGLLVFDFGEGYEIPTCNHNEKPGKPCHPGPVLMTPTKRWTELP